MCSRIPEGYLVGATSMVWEDELYTYGGLAPEGGFVDIIPAMVRQGPEHRATEPGRRIRTSAYLRVGTVTRPSSWTISSTSSADKGSLAA